MFCTTLSPSPILVSLFEMAASSSSSMACLLCPDLNSAELAAAKPYPRLRRLFRTPVLRPRLIPASRTFSDLRCACVCVRVIRSEVGEKKDVPFLYARARPEVRWPHRSDEFHQQRIARESENAGRIPSRVVPNWEDLTGWDARVGVAEERERDAAGEDRTSLAWRLEREEMIRKREAFRQRQKGQVRRIQSMSKLALRKATDMKNRSRRLSTVICELELARPVADVLDGWPERLNNEEMSVVVKHVGDENWRRALELYECLTLRKWYTPNPRLLATILRILGRANQLEPARELFLSAEPELTSCIQVFNAILGVYAKQGQWLAAQHILELMELRGCEPDITTYNTIANARCKDDLPPGMASALLKEIETAGLTPDIITYNTLLGGCIANKNITEATEIIKEMERRGFDPNTCSSYVLGEKYLRLDGKISTLAEAYEQQAPSNNEVRSFSADNIVQQASRVSTQYSQEAGETSADSPLNTNRKDSKPPHKPDGESKEVSTPYFVAERGTAEKGRLVYRREHVFEGNLEEIVKGFYHTSQLKLCTPSRGSFSRQTEGVLKELCKQTDSLRHLFSWGVVQKECDSPKARSFCMRMIEAEMEHVCSVQGIDRIALEERNMLRKFSQAWHHLLQFRLLEFSLLVHQMFTPYLCSPEATCHPGDESRFTAICLFMQWKEVHIISPVVQGMQPLRRGLVVSSERLSSRKPRPCRMHTTGWLLGDLYHTIRTESYKQLHLCKATHAPFPGTEEDNHLLSDLGQLDKDLVQVAMQETSREIVQSANASGYKTLINEYTINKDYSSGRKQLMEMVDAGIEPGYMIWICVLQACGQCTRRIDLLRLLAALRDAGCPLPLRLILEREGVMAEVENWFRNLQATTADGGQGMVNVLVDILWAFKLRATAGHVYDLAVRLDIYPRNFARVEEQN